MSHISPKHASEGSQLFEEPSVDCGSLREQGTFRWTAGFLPGSCSIFQVKTMIEQLITKMQEQVGVK